MRPALALTLAGPLVLLACGGGGDSGGSGGGGGGGGGTSARLVASGAIPLTANQFTSVTQATTCNAAGVDVGVAFAVVGASDQAGMCGYLQQGQEKQNAKSILVAMVRLNPLGSASIVEDTYPVVAEVTVAQQKYAFVVVSQTDLACSSTDETATGGSVVLTSVANGRVKGTVNATLPGGGTVAGTFDAPACAVDLLAQGDVCSGTIGPGAPACAP